ncbi:SMP-30/gluconolactonase/LRE family protein [Streptomyces sp. NEAU-W12]|uniref:SMP-30/gluconolactonase/LRE family protein n=1 Tax=Streptomyces sp. NEAU-W12 TaxID=2994668 RepID=UPI00224B7496|nr:SMP-30/gluconolactonase/LRE family protein [Streptomyces sp. NEAU-W12]MCX2922870.1 SMP-30/gluconolactonase/LRE family protein [Streptomyces sp. NEAU-W12]
MTTKSDAASYEVAVRARSALGEGPTWDAAAGRLLWIDILGSRIHTYDPATGRRTLRRSEQHVGAVKPRAGGGLVLNLRDGVGLLDPDDTFRWLRHEPVPGRRGNDAAVAPDGALWTGTMRYDEATGGGTLARVTGDGTAETVLDDVTVSNGTGWSPDGRLMYYIDTPTRRIDVFDHDPDTGRVTGRRPLAEVEDGAGFPDGLTVDAGGCVWVALWDGAAVRRYTPAGALDRVIELPVPRVTACAFGGRGLTDLYITTARVGLDPAPPLAGSLLVVPGAGEGVAQPAFAG